LLDAKTRLLFNVRLFTAALKTLAGKVNKDEFPNTKVALALLASIEPDVLEIVEQLIFKVFAPKVKIPSVKAKAFVTETVPAKVLEPEPVVPRL
jgi:hypothetical protein